MSMAKNASEFIRDVTEQVIRYMDTPKQLRQNNRNRKESWQYRWFGMMPVTMRLWKKRWRIGKKH